MSTTLSLAVRVHDKYAVETPISGDAVAAAHRDGVYTLGTLRPRFLDRAPWCPTCQTATAMTPSHDASANCQSGGRSHCTCGTCY